MSQGVGKRWQLPVDDLSRFVHCWSGYWPSVWRRSLSVSLSAAIALGLGGCAATATEATEIELSEALEQPQELRKGPVQVRFRYRQDAEAWGGEVQYTLLYNGQPHLEQIQESTSYGAVSLEDLDADGIAEVIVRIYSGGAHCCTNHIIHRWQGDRFETIDTGFRDGGGGGFQDLDSDGRLEFVSFDNAFLYAFSSYAGSFPPSQIWALQDGQFVDVTRQHPAELRAIAKQMREAIQRIQAEPANENEVNGLLAGYVAQMILLGEYEQGWAFMLANYDRTSDWGLEIYEGDQVVGQHADFPTALKAFLIERGYLTADGSTAL
ncbi:MAG: hypothetical protein SNJ57_05415 [Cyanobacteriota bacterium]